MLAAALPLHDTVWPVKVCTVEQPASSATITTAATRFACSAEPGEQWSWCYVDEVGFLAQAG